MIALLGDFVIHGKPGGRGSCPPRRRRRAWPDCAPATASSPCSGTTTGRTTARACAPLSKAPASAFSRTRRRADDGLEAAIGDQKRASEALQEAQKALAHVTRLTTISALTASLTHEVSQPLAGIAVNATASLRWLAHTPPALDKATQAMQRVIRDALRAGDVIGHARALVKKSGEEKSLVHVDQVIREVLSLVQPEVQKHAVVVEEALAEGLLPVLADRIRLQQLVLNLIMNAIEAMAEVTGRPRRLVISCERGKVEVGPGVLVGVQDTGVGAAADDLEKLFDPFFTTKRDGLGMGLSIGRSIAQAHGGRLWARRNADHGLTFHLLVPETSNPRV